MTPPSIFFRLLHLSDSALPVGGFAFSNGLESMIQTGFIQTRESFKNYLEGFCQQIRSFDLYFAKECYTLDDPPFGNKLKALSQEIDSMVLIPSIRKASLLQGKNWFRILDEIFPKAKTSAIQKWYEKNNLPAHSAITLPLCFIRLGLSLVETETLLIYQTLRDHISAAIRLNLIGPMEGHRLQVEIYEKNFQENKELENSFPNQMPFKSSYLLEIAQANHERLYSKLFQN